MAEEDIVTEQQLISGLSHCPYEARRGMIRATETPKPSLHASASSSVGALDLLPPEVLHSILTWLDFLSILRFSLASKRANESVHSLPAHRDLFLHASAALAALGRTRTIAHHSAGRLRAVLRAWRCLYCGGFGAYLFLPTCERCCWFCLENNPALWVVSRGVAGKCFSLSSAELDLLPTLLSIPGQYCVGYDTSVQKDRQRLVAVKAAKQLALSIHQSEDKILGLAKKIPRISSKRLSQYRHYHAAAVEPPPEVDVASQPAGRLAASHVRDPFPGMASIPFPAVTRDGLEHGLWCRGCDDLLETYGMRYFIPGCEAPVPIWTLFMSMRRCSYTRRHFLGHIDTCYGAQRIAARAGLEAWSRRVHKTDRPPPMTPREVVAMLAEPVTRWSCELQRKKQTAARDE
jgi:hypothetical protein